MNGTLKVTATALTLLMLTACGGREYSGADTTLGAQASIPFLSRATVRDWHADDDRTLYIQHMDRNWYRADLFGPCTGLPYATVVGFANESAAGSFNRFSDIIVDGQVCKVTSVVRSAPPAGLVAERSQQ